MIDHCDSCVESCESIAATCGTIAGCNGSLECGSCELPETCGGGDNPLACGCKPSCGTRECGSDGCGGSCGSCNLGESCEDGTCAIDPISCVDNFDCASGLCDNNVCKPRVECAGNPTSQEAMECSSDSACSPYLTCVGEVPAVFDGNCFEPCRYGEGGGYQTCCGNGRHCGKVAINLVPQEVCCVPGTWYELGDVLPGICNVGDDTYQCHHDSDCPTAWGLNVCKIDGSEPGTCVECLIDDDCPWGVCFQEQCVECNEDTDCQFSGEPRCSDHECVRCVEDDDCSDSHPRCTADNECVQCMGDKDCPSDLPHCSSYFQCRACLEDSDCPLQKPYCNYQCSACDTDSDCPAETPVCDYYGDGCVECTDNSDCGSGYLCDRDNNTCYACQGCLDLCEECDLTSQCGEDLYCSYADFGTSRCRNDCFLFCYADGPQTNSCENFMCACEQDL
ncbi:MAG: hypothetical protein A2289_24400 [Deltaproteobacteria bacterium RIFOXYA12_FULL_58_15]|nr:MAG: hypothetical protein A2289_24400 [Deltaproteobacteria bacterium RIFOXYA12_FULL_58_15]